MNARVVFGGLVAVLLVVNGLVASKEWLLQRGDLLLLPLETRDPRSLMQGDYMTLRYAVSTDALKAVPDPPRDGTLVVTLDERRVATFARYHQDEPLQPNEHLLRYRRREDGGALRLGAESFFFQEGQGERYARARFGVLRATSTGSSVLAGLADEQTRPIRSLPR